MKPTGRETANGLFLHRRAPAGVTVSSSQP
jgi:hypothetical protein